MLNANISSLKARRRETECIEKMAASTDYPLRFVANSQLHSAMECGHRIRVKYRKSGKFNWTGASARQRDKALAT
jgi:hypothetical protein